MALSGRPWGGHWPGRACPLQGARAEQTGSTRRYGRRHQAVRAGPSGTSSMGGGRRRTSPSCSLARATRRFRYSTVMNSGASTSSGSWAAGSTHRGAGCAGRCRSCGKAAMQRGTACGWVVSVYLDARAQMHGSRGLWGLCCQQTRRRGKHTSLCLEGMCPRFWWLQQSRSVPAGGGAPPAVVPTARQHPRKLPQGPSVNLQRQQPHLPCADAAARAVLHDEAHQQAAAARQLRQLVVKAQQAHVQVVRSGVQLAQRAERSRREGLAATPGMACQGCGAGGAAGLKEQRVQMRNLKHLAGRGTGDCGRGSKEHGRQQARLGGGGRQAAARLPDVHTCTSNSLPTSSPSVLRLEGLCNSAAASAGTDNSWQLLGCSS